MACFLMRSANYQQQTLFSSLDELNDVSYASPKECHVVAVGKQRDGSTRFWCLRHKADATAKYGRPAKVCRNAHIPPLSKQDTLELNIDKYRGGVALWGAVAPVYDTTRQKLDRGIHVHARDDAGEVKKMDRTVRMVRIFSGRLPKEGISVAECEAIYYMVTSIFGFEMRHITCSHCGHPHLDRDWFSVHPHRRHLCAACGRYFWDTEAALGNPICGLRAACGVEADSPRPSKKELRIRQKDFMGGIRVWGSNPAFLWTGQDREEEGIHIHAFCENGDAPELDETYFQVTIDEMKLDPVMVRILMAQKALSFLKDRVLTINCPSCGEAQFAIGELAVTPVGIHSCTRCGHQFASPGRFRKTIANPLPGLLVRLAEKAPRQPQQHDLDLIPERL